MSWLFWLNFLVCQWFGFRVVRDLEWRIVGVLFPVLPLTGWWGRFYPYRQTLYVRPGYTRIPPC